jgi:hypothetical protein
MSSPTEMVNLNTLKVVKNIDEVSTQTQSCESKEVPWNFFENLFSKYIQKLRFIIILVGLLMAGYSGYRCSEIQGKKTTGGFINADHELWRSVLNLVDDYNRTKEGPSIVVDFMWGVKGINQTMVDSHNPSDIGTAIWDDSFIMSTSQAQQDVYDFCQNLYKHKELLVFNDSVSCWIDDFKNWVIEDG